MKTYPIQGKPTYVKKHCEVCNNLHEVKKADLKRGWGKCCDKSCASKLRELNHVKNYVKDNGFYQTTEFGEKVFGIGYKNPKKGKLHFLIIDKEIKSINERFNKLNDWGTYKGGTSIGVIVLALRKKDPTLVGLTEEEFMLEQVK